MNNTQINKTIDELIEGLIISGRRVMRRAEQLKVQYEKEDCGDSEDVTDKLPSMTEALKLRETMNEIKKIYGWCDEIDDDFIGSVKEREEVFKKYYSCPDIKEKYEKLEEENEKLREAMEVGADVILKSLNEEQAKIIRELKEENEKLEEEIKELKGGGLVAHLDALKLDED